jgi:hypothetical protein
MPHKFKIGDIVHYRPKDRMLNTARGTYTVTWLMPALEGQQPEYRIKHFSLDDNLDAALLSAPACVEQRFCNSVV